MFQILSYQNELVLEMGTQILGFEYVPEINRPKCEMS